jgi:2-amino-4-hydroxy-6-hydroxymethyldihydropteridine diphosphokinase
VSRAVLSIGSNVGDRLANLQSVLDRLDGAALAASPVYQTAPWGEVDQDDFLNAVVIAADPARDAAGWLRFGQECERAAGRVRGRRWGPRTLDVDVIDVDGARSSAPELTLPHPRAHERAFVLVPWLDADAGAELAGHGKVASLVEALPAGERAGVHRRDDLALVVPA